MENSGAFGGSNSFNQLAGLERRTRTLEDSSLDLLARIQRLEKEAGIGSISISLSAPVKESLTAPDSMPIAEALPAAPVAAVRNPFITHIFDGESELQPESNFDSKLDFELESEPDSDPAVPVPLAYPLKKMLAARDSAAALHETESDGDPSAVNTAGGAVAGAESIESRIGLYWLSRLGIGFLVVGIALFIMYSFNNFGPVAKIATGYIFAAALLGLGEMMERRDNMPWYARLIEGGAWAVGFFTTYAMHHVEAVKVIASPLVDLGLLMGVTALAVSHATAKKSEMMAIFAVGLGFITLGLSHITGFTALAATMLVALSVVLTVRQGWYQLFLYSVFASYGALVYSGALGVRGQETSVLNLLLFLVPSLCGFSLVPLFLKAQDKMASQTLTIGLVLNNLAFLTLFFNHADKLLGAAVAPYALAVGGWFFLIGYLAKRQGQSFYASLFSLFGLATTTAFFSLSRMGGRAWPWLSLEAAVLSYAGLEQRLKTFRWFGYAVGFLAFVGAMTLTVSNHVVTLFGVYVPEVLSTGAVAVAAFTFAAYLNRRSRFSADIPSAERRLGFLSFWHFSVMLLWTIPLTLSFVTFDKIGGLPEHQQMHLLIACWSALAVYITATAAALRERFMPVLAILTLVWMALPVCEAGSFSWAISGTAAALIGALAFAMRRFRERLAPAGSFIYFQITYLLFIAVTCVLPCAGKLATTPATILWSAAGLGSLALGFVLKDQFLRCLAPLVLLLACSVAAFPDFGISQNLPWQRAFTPVLSCWLAWFAYKRMEKNGIAAGEDGLYHVYSILATSLTTACISRELTGAAMPVAWSLNSLLLVAAGIVLKRPSLRVIGMLSMLGLVFNQASRPLDYELVTPTVIALFAGWASYKFVASDNYMQGECDFRHVYSVVGTALLTFMLGHNLHNTWVSCAWAIEGIVILLTGFISREKALRINGLVLFGVLTFRLFFVDLAAAATIYRIAAFFVTGCILLLSAYAYNRFAANFDLDLPFNANDPERSPT